MRTINIDKVATISYSDEKILHLKFFKGASVDDKIAEQLIEASSKISNNEVHANLVDTSEMMFMSRAARQVFAQQERNYIICIAVVINSKLQSVLANMYLSINRPKIQTKMFDNYEDANNWLKEKMKSKNA